MVDTDWEILLVSGNVSCPLPVVVRGHVPALPGGYLIGDKAPIVCELGSVVQPSTSAVLVCQHDGQWHSLTGDTQLPSCEGKYTLNDTLDSFLIHNESLYKCTFVDE